MLLEAPAPPEADTANLASNGLMIRMLQSALSQGESSVRTIPNLFRKILKREMWRAFAFSEGGAFRWNAAEFRRFLEAPRPAGCQTSVALVERLLRGTDAWDPYLEAIRGEQGQPNWQDQERSDDGRFGGRNGNMITVTEDPEPPVSIPLSPDVPRPERKRDYARESKQGTSVSYAIRRLSKHRPDLHERVRAGELTPHAAMVLAGFRPKAITIPADPESAARRLALHFRGEAMRRLIAGLEAAARQEH